MDYPSFFHPGISAAKNPAPDLLGSEEEEEEDGDLYAELWQQILQLTSDSDDNPVGPTNRGPFPVAAPSPITCSDWWVDNKNVQPSSVWWLSPSSHPSRSRSGTGVFIPSIATTERRGRRGKARKEEAAKKQVEN